MDGFEVGQLVIRRIDAGAEEQPRISPVDNLCAAFEFDKVRLILLVSRCNEAMNLIISGQ